MSRFLTAIMSIVLCIIPLCSCTAAFMGTTAAKMQNNESGYEIIQTDKNKILQEVLDDFKAPDSGTILRIAEKYYRRALSKATVEEKNIINQIITWEPDFSGKTIDPARAMEYSYASAFLTSYTDLKDLYLALNSAVLAYDVKDPVSAANLASAIIAYPEDAAGKPLGSISKDAASYTDDAAVVYQYALSLKAFEKEIDMSVIPLLLNYGYLCLDTDRPDAAKPLFEAAIKIAPDYLPACEGMAAYWLAAGDRFKAEEVLKKAKRPAFFAMIAKAGENTTEAKAPTVTEQDELPVMEEKIKTLSDAPVILATDFYEDVDPKGADDARKFVDNLACQWKFTVPKYDYLTQYSTLSAITSGQGQAALNAFTNVFQEYSRKYSKAQVTSSLGMMGSLGLSMDLGGIDINDLMQNPEKYKDMDLKDKIKVTGLDQLKDRINDLQNQAERAQSDLKSGDVSSTINMTASVAPEMDIFQMNPSDYANPSDIMTQRYNMTILLRKLGAYRSYFFKQNERITTTLNDNISMMQNKMAEVQRKMQDELDQLKEEHKTSHDAHFNMGGVDIYIPQEGCDNCKVKMHQIHLKYLPELNNIAETSFADRTNYINPLFINKLKPNIEAMYADCMKNCMLISDPQIRKLKEDEINTMVYQAVLNTYTSVLTAYSHDNKYPYSCDCDPAEVAAAEERIQKAYEEEQANKQAMENRARKEFEQGVIKESSQLYQKLDKYSAEYKLLFMQAKWHPLKTELRFDLKVPHKAGKDEKISLETGGSFKMVENHINNKTSHSLRLYSSISGNAVNGVAGAEGSVAVQGEWTTDGSGNVVYADVSGEISGAATAGSINATVSYKTSVMRGSKFSAQVAEVYNDGLNPTGLTTEEKKNLSRYTDALKTFMPDKPRKVLWNGKYQVNE